MHPLLPHLMKMASSETASSGAGGGRPVPSPEAWALLYRRLGPVIGRQGFGLLLSRSVAEAGRDFEALRVDAFAPGTLPEDAARIFEQLSAAERGEAIESTLSHFLATLEDLIGRELLTQLLRAEERAPDTAGGPR